MSCEAEKKKKPLQIANCKKQILTNDAKGKTEIPFLSIYRRLFYKIICHQKGEQGICSQNCQGKVL